MIKPLKFRFYLVYQLRYNYVLPVWYGGRHIGVVELAGGHYLVNVVGLTICRMVVWWSCRIVDWWNDGVVELLNQRLV